MGKYFDKPEFYHFLFCIVVMCLLSVGAIVYQIKYPSPVDTHVHAFSPWEVSSHKKKWMDGGGPVVIRICPDCGEIERK